MLFRGTYTRLEDAKLEYPSDGPDAKQKARIFSARLSDLVSLLEGNDNFLNDFDLTGVFKKVGDHKFQITITEEFVQFLKENLNIMGTDLYRVTEDSKKYQGDVTWILTPVGSSDIIDDYDTWTGELADQTLLYHSIADHTDAPDEPEDPQEREEPDNRNDLDDPEGVS